MLAFEDVSEHAHDHRAPAGLLATVASHVLDTGTQWDIGTFGAIAEFMRDEGEPAAISNTPNAISISTARGAMRLEENPDARLVAYETVGRAPGMWRHGVAVCLPDAACLMHSRRGVTEIGPDEHAIQAEDRGAILFDVGLGALQTDVCIRTRDRTLLRTLRAADGSNLFGGDGSVLAAVLEAGPHRVLLSRVGRVEVFQPIPPPTGRSPDGPHTHILPKLLRAGRTHAATTPMPDGFVPCAHFYPPHPLRDIRDAPRPFLRRHSDEFQVLHSRFGIAHLVALQRQVIAAVGCGQPPSAADIPTGRFARSYVRIALRKLKAGGEASAAVLDQWLAAYDRIAVDGDGEEELIHTC